MLKANLKIINKSSISQYAYNICAKFQIDCLNTLGGVDYTNLLPNIEAKPENCLSPKCRNFDKNDFLAC